MTDTTSPIAIITGAGSGVGRAAALALLDAGYGVALAGRQEATLVETAGRSPHADRALVVPTDVTDETAVQALFARTSERFGHLDLLFNNAGTGAPAVPLDELTLDQWQHVIDVNLTGMFLCLREAFRVMKQQTPKGGRIINNGSISAYVPRPNSIPYTATKHGVSGMTRSASLDGREHNIAVGQIDIGNAATDLTRPMAAGIVQANGETRVEPVIDVTLVGRAIVQMASLPLDANVLFQTIMATRMPYVGRG